MIDEKWGRPVWDTDLVKDETILFVRDKNGLAEGKLLFEADEIISVTNTRRTEIYEEGVDYTVKGNTVTLTENSRIFVLGEEELYPEKPEEGKFFPTQSGNLLFSEGSFFIDMQVAVTYKVKKNDWSGIKPALADKELPRTFSLLREGKPFTFVLYGDSISCGANHTGELGIPPYQPRPGDMLMSALIARYGKNVNHVNTSCGGKDSNWAIENIEENVNKYVPDLVIIGFGMNDGWQTTEQFEANIRKMIELIRAKKPECEFILVATSLPNKILTHPDAKFWGNQQYFLENLKKIAADTEGVAVANISDMHRELLRRKKFLDLTSNNVNHPNDFFYMCHAHFFDAMLID